VRALLASRKSDDALEQALTYIEAVDRGDS
jgi:hypothetical protein